jgi:fermentation-respiration switch protein FrsA (DUF1100 family)
MLDCHACGDRLAVKSVVVLLLVFYAALVGLMYFAQRGLMYFPDRQRVAPAAAGLPQAAEETLTTTDGERVIVWHVPPREGRPVVLYFQGNGGGLPLRVARFAALARDGIGLVALNYRGYGGSSGSPNEEGLIADAHAAYEFAAARYEPKRIVPWGESLGSGVAVALAAEKPVAKIVLEAPFTSAADVGARAYPFLPVRWLMKDQFRSDERIARVGVPVLILHGERDGVVPIALGERLFELVPGPKRFVRYPQAGHEGLDGHGALDEVKKFLAE